MLPPNADAVVVVEAPPNVNPVLLAPKADADVVVASEVLDTDAVDGAAVLPPKAEAVVVPVPPNADPPFCWLPKAEPPEEPKRPPDC